MTASSANGSSKRNEYCEAGFTLLEILIVLMLIAIISTAAILSISGGAHRQLHEEALLLQSSLVLAADEAIYNKSPTGVILTQSSYLFVRYEVNARKWEVFTDRALRMHGMPESLKLSLNSDNTNIILPAEKKEISITSPSLIFLPTGEMTPFTLSIASRSDDEAITVSTDGVAPIAEQKRGVDESGQ